MRKTLWLIPLILSTWGCGAWLHQPMRPSQARIGELTSTYYLLKSLPKPVEPIVAAVYKFQDQTGQYKLSENGGSFSTAVTQGGTTILIRALEESGWFIPIERENIGNLLNERKLIRSSHIQYGGDPNKAVPPLLFAGIILEGGIVSYDANIITGGAGLRYFGTGGSGQYRQDRVTVYLRAVSTNTGKVLKTVYTSRTLLTQAVDVGLFRFVSFKRLLEFETGYTYTEPSELAVTEAIEKAVQVLVLEGLEEGLWAAADPEAAAQALKAYRAEKERMEATDWLQRRPRQWRRPVALGMSFGTTLYQGDYPNATLLPAVDLEMQRRLNNWWSIGGRFGLGALGTFDYFRTKASYAELTATCTLMPFDKATPWFRTGLGMLFTEDEEGRFSLSAKSQFAWSVAAGVEVMSQQQTALFFGIEYHYPFDDMLDNTANGRFNDYYYQLSAGLRVYLGKEPSPRPARPTF